MTERRRTATDTEVHAAIQALDATPELIPAPDWQARAQGLAVPGLYAWWVNTSGAADLSGGLAGDVAAGRIYAGQAGATKWPSGKVGGATLRSRISSQHLGGNIGGSTFRLTLASVLVDELGLRPIAARKIGRDGENRLSQWMRDHLTVAVHPFEDRDALADLEHLVLAELNPPLNLEGRPASGIRAALTRLRAGLPAA
jgi:hypothetical protein